MQLTSHEECGQSLRGTALDDISRLDSQPVVVARSASLAKPTLWSSCLISVLATVFALHTGPLRAGGEMLTETLTVAHPVTWLSRAASAKGFLLRASARDAGVLPCAHSKLFSQTPLTRSSLSLIL